VRILHADAPALHGRHAIEQSVVFAICRGLEREKVASVIVVKMWTREEITTMRPAAADPEQATRSRETRLAEHVIGNA
jgi:hypothetical protein